MAKEEQTVIDKFQKHARVPGFRRGKVPAGIIRQRFSEDIKSELVEHLIPRYFRQETEKQHLVPVSQPQVTDLDLDERQANAVQGEFRGPAGDRRDRVPGDSSGKEGNLGDATKRSSRRSGIFASSMPPTKTWKRAARCADGDYAQAAFSGTSRKPTPSR